MIISITCISGTATVNIDDDADVFEAVDSYKRLLLFAGYHPDSINEAIGDY